MRQVSKEVFFQTLYADSRDIMPRIVGNFDPEHGYTSEWVTNNHYRTLFGKSTGGTHLAEAKYYLID